MKRPETISVEELKRRMGQPGVVVVDLRSAGEYQEMHIPGAVHVPYENLGQLSRYRDKSIILYCEHGITSMAAAVTLAENGYRVSSLRGGVQAYRSRER
ncbi:MAG TPA: rhodanese-like domain-containing protein [Lachnospiraceae bacterium]|nr:rhodanese-like domain-containing protein [Lachnospiraceae bacterium]